MAGGSILDADMRTLGLRLRSGFAWWRSELGAMLPASLRSGTGRLRSFALYNGPGQIEAVGQGADRPVLVDPSLCLVREIDLPAIAAADFAQLVAMEADRIFPLAPDILAIGHARAAHGRARVAALPLDTAREMLAELRDAGMVPAVVGLARASEPGAMSGVMPGVMDIDFTPSLAAAGLVAPVRDGAARWWLLAGFLFAGNLGLLVWRDVESVARLDELVTQQAPAVKGARAITARIARTQTVAEQVAVRRRGHDALGTLVVLTRAMPAAAWVQRYTWDGAAIRITGYRRPQADVAAALRSSKRFGDVRSANTEAVTEVQTGLPFDIAARVEGGAS
jgi:hypothetical protein